MEWWKSKFLYHLVKAVVLMHDLVLLKRAIEEQNEFPDVRATLQVIYHIYSRDPDLVSIYYNAQKKLKACAYASEAEGEALKVLLRIAEEFIQKAAKAAAKI